MHFKKKKRRNKTACGLCKPHKKYRKNATKQREFLKLYME